VGTVPVGNSRVVRLFPPDGSELGVAPDMVPPDAVVQVSERLFENVADAAVEKVLQGYARGAPIDELIRTLKRRAPSKRSDDQ